MSEGLDITRYAPKDTPLPKPLVISPAARDVVNAFISGYAFQIEEAYPHICSAVARFQNNPYQGRSLWFKKQNRHCVTVLEIRFPNEPVRSLLLHLDFGDDALLLTSPEETPLDDETYHARRLVEEVLVDYHEIFAQDPP